MKLTVFQSDSGDCLLLESADEKRILVDGGMSTAYREHVAPALGAMRDAEKQLDLVYVSHIDRDHIGGILQLMQDELDWRVFEFRSQDPASRARPPKAPRPPEVLEIWHNAFKPLIDLDPGPVSDELAAAAEILAGGDEDDDAALAQLQRELATGVGEGIVLSQRVSAEQLDIPLNKAFGDKLALVRDGQAPITLGSLELTVIGPFADNLEELRKDWNEWLRTNRKALDKALARMRADVSRLGTGDLDLLRTAVELQASELGDRSDVTPPNLASLMLLVTEGTKTLLLTGDGHLDEILEGLERAGRLDAQGAIHVDALKVQHHGAEANIDEEFCRRVTADHYVFCGNGEHSNPEPAAINAILDARLAAPGRPFKLWFNSRSTVARGKGNDEHMRMVEDLMTAAAARDARVSFEFLEGHSFELPL